MYQRQWIIRDINVKEQSSFIYRILYIDNQLHIIDFKLRRKNNEKYEQKQTRRFLVKIVNTCIIDFCVIHMGVILCGSQEASFLFVFL